MPEFNGTRDIRSYLRTLWRWKFLALFFVIVCPLAAYLLERGKPNVYTTSALVGVNQTTVNASPGSGGSFSTTNVLAVARLVTTSPVATVAADILHEPGAAAQIVGEVTSAGDPTTDFVTIGVTDHSPQRAAAIANAFAQAISRNLQNTALNQLRASIASLQTQLLKLKRNDPTRPTLLTELNQLRAAEATQGNEAAVLQPARPPSSPSGPHLHRTVELGLLIGILLAFGAVVLAESADRRIRTPEDLEGMTELTMLASIAPTAFSAELLTTPQDEEAFQMLRTTLMYFNVEHLDSVMITSAGEKEGKTTIAVRLALVCAEAGMNVVLIDADLRRAQTSARFGIRRRDGLSSVLSGQRSLEDVFADHTFEDRADSGGRLRIVPAGSPPPNPSALIGSQRMLDALSQLKADSDLVIIDTPAALAVSDCFALVPSVSGVVLVARMNRSTRQTIRRLQNLVKATHGRLLGVVATGVTAGAGYYEHYSTKYYAQNGAGHRKGIGRLRKPSTDHDEVPSANPE
jgi:capsular exopolysaccharide synthesis family protein